MRFRGRVWKLGDDVNTDLIISGRYKYDITDMKELSKHAFEDVRPELPRLVKPGDIIVAGRNFGCGSSREHAPRVIKALGVSVVVAESFARLFYRNAVNIGLPVVECRNITGFVEEGDVVSVDLEKGVIENETRGGLLRVRPMPRFILDILREGGIVNYVKRRGGLEVG